MQLFDFRALWRLPLWSWRAHFWHAASARGDASNALNPVGIGPSGGEIPGPVFGLSRHHSVPWGLWGVTNGPSVITPPVRIPMEGRLVSGTSGGGLPWEESHSGSRHHSLPWGLWRMTDGPLMITAPLRISMAGPLGSSCSGGGCHVRRASLALDITAFPGDYGE